MKLRIFRGHVRGCSAVRNAEAGRWRSPWAFGVGQMDERDGRKSMVWFQHPVTYKPLRQPYLVWICNATDCHAIAGVPLRDAERAIIDAE